jgi:hypothetical protein
MIIYKSLEIRAIRRSFVRRPRTRSRSNGHGQPDTVTKINFVPLNALRSFTLFYAQIFIL